MLRLRELVGSLLSINALREHLAVSHKTLVAWLAILERLYAIFRVWSVIPDPGARFENLVAAHLLKWVHWQQDTEGLDSELRYFRDTDGREVDFVVMHGRKPVLLVECKLGDESLDKSLRYLHERFPSADAWQVSLEGTRDYVTPEGIRVAPALQLLRTLV